MNLPIFQVDAFAEDLFKGNPAAVVPLDAWLPEQLMQQIAMENNLSETAFFVKEEDHYSIRWFTPAKEVVLCGHATLATAHILFSEMNVQTAQINFISKSGVLTVEKNGHLLILDFPADFVRPAELPSSIARGMKIQPQEAYKGKTDYLLVYDSEETVRNMSPDFSLLRQTDARGIIATAQGNNVDFVSRFFAPGVGIDEDPVTGSAHTLLIPFWSQKLQKKEMKAEQISRRGGKLWCVLSGERVKIGGKAITFLKGSISIPAYQ